jgi:hypothetical protein
VNDLREDKPSEADAIRIATEFWGHPAQDAQRFQTGIGHWVYAVRSTGGASVVVRLGTAAQQEDFAGAVHWSNVLRPLGVPLPELLRHGQSNGFPYIVLERLGGKDLGLTYTSLDTCQKRAIANEVQRVQTLVGRLPRAAG